MKGLFQRSPYAAVMIAMAMLSLAGIPPFPGFVAKFLIFKNVMAAGFTVYAVLGLVGSYLGIYFYLRVIQYLFMSAGESATVARAPGRLPLYAGVHVPRRDRRGRGVPRLDIEPALIVAGWRTAPQQLAVAPRLLSPPTWIGSRSLPAFR